MNTLLLAIFLAAPSASASDAIRLSTTSAHDNIRISSTGVTTFSPYLHNVASMTIPQFTTTNIYCDVCATSSTITMTTSGGRVELVFSGVIYNNNSQIAGLNFLIDGGYAVGFSSTSLLRKSSWNPAADYADSSRLISPVLSAGTHSFCVSACSPDSGETTYLVNSPYAPNIFYAKEIK